MILLVWAVLDSSSQAVKAKFLLIRLKVVGILSRHIQPTGLQMWQRRQEVRLGVGGSLYEAQGLLARLVAVEQQISVDIVEGASVLALFHSCG